MLLLCLLLILVLVLMVLCLLLLLHTPLHTPLLISGGCCVAAEVVQHVSQGSAQRTRELHTRGCLVMRQTHVKSVQKVAHNCWWKAGIALECGDGGEEGEKCGFSCELRA